MTELSFCELPPWDDNAYSKQAVLHEAGDCIIKSSTGLNL